MCDTGIRKDVVPVKFNSSIGERLFKYLFFAVYSVFLFGLCCTFYQGVAMGIPEWDLCFALVIFAFAIPCTQYQSAPGELTPEGVYVRHFLTRRFYPWSEILQAGILKRHVKGMPHEIILVKSGGSPRKPGDNESLFLLRNPFRLIHIPDDQELVDYITTHYGPLAYDQRKGVWEN